MKPMIRVRYPEKKYDGFFVKESNESVEWVINISDYLRSREDKMRELNKYLYNTWVLDDMMKMPYNLWVTLK